MSDRVYCRFVCVAALAFLSGVAPAWCDSPRLTPVPASISGKNSVRVPLDGTWQFHPAPPAGFWSADAELGEGWKDIEVPGEWVMQGFTVEKDAATGYWREIAVPDEWKGKRIVLHCDGVYSDATVWVNGIECGRHEGGFTPFELDVTSAARIGVNRIALAVKNESLADVLASATQYAAHPLGGITRKLYLFAVSELHVGCLHVTTEFDAAYRDATIRAEVEVLNSGTGPVEGAHLRFALTGPDGATVPVEPETTLPPIPQGDTWRETVSLPVAGPRPWDPEHPNLYTLSCEVQRGIERVETVQRRFGFRQVEVRGPQVFVNNRPVKLRGVCRHEVHPLRGRSLTPEWWRKDAEEFRAANVNYIRTSHYPPAEEFIEACDELGLFVEEEAPLCWVGHGANPAWKDRAPDAEDLRDTIARVTLETIQRDRSHPSVIIWSLANESLWGPNFVYSFELANQLDPSRPKSFHDQAWGKFNDEGSAAQIAVYHYPAPEEANHPDRLGRPMLFGEYCHLNCYNREEIVTDPGVRDAWGEAIADMWERMYAGENCLGGAIWSGIDDVFDLPNGRCVGYGEWGPIDGWRREKPEYWHVKKAHSPIRIKPERLPDLHPGDPIEFTVENRNDFTNLSEIAIDWKIGDASGKATADIPPHAAGTLALPPLAQPATDSAVELTFTSPRGFVIDTFRVPIGEDKLASEKTAPSKSSARPPELSSDNDSFFVRAEGGSYRIDRKTGQIRSAEANGETVLSGGPVLMLLPLKGGQCATEHSADIAPFNAVCTEWNAESVETRQTSDGVVVQVKGAYKEASGAYTMTIDGAGGLRVAYRFAVKDKLDPRQTGMVFRVPRAFDRLEWQRDAQWSVYPDDHIGRPHGVARAFAPNEVAAAPAQARPYSLDSNALGTNDFRSSKRHVRWASLTDETTGRGIEVRSDGHHTVRSFVDGDAIGWLVAAYSNGGGEPFVSSHFKAERRPLNPGDAVEDTLQLCPLSRKN